MAFRPAARRSTLRRVATPLWLLTSTVGLAGGLAGCGGVSHYAGSPFVGFPGFVRDAHTFSLNPNLPPGHEETKLESEGKQSQVEALLPEGGNIWPGPAPLDPTLGDVGKMLAEPGGGAQQLQQLNPTGPQAVPTLPNGMPFPHGSSTPPGAVQTAPSVVLPTPHAYSAPPASTQPVPPSTFSTPAGPLINNGPIGVPGGASTATNPAGGGQNIVVPNGNGTDTIIAPDGTTTIVPSPK